MMIIIEIILNDYMIKMKNPCKRWRVCTYEYICCRLVLLIWDHLSLEFIENNKLVGRSLSLNW